MRQDKILLISGSRDWTDELAICQLLLLFDPHWTLVIHGAARGADRLGAFLALALGFYVIPFPADWRRDQYGRYDRGAGPKRNEEMRDFCVQNRQYGVEIHAGIFPLAHSRGTLGMYDLCRLAGFHIHVPEARKSYL